MRVMEDKHAQEKGKLIPILVLEEDREVVSMALSRVYRYQED